MFFRIHPCLFVLLVLASAGESQGQQFERQKLLASDAAAKMQFGDDVAMDGTTIVVGSSIWHTPGGDWVGAAYLFDQATGSQQGILTASNGLNGDYFGEAVDVHGSRVLVGAASRSVPVNDGGAAYLFDTSTQAEVAVLQPADLANGDDFGQAVALNDMYALVSSDGDATPGIASGAVYVFDPATGSQLMKIVPPDPIDNQLFGDALDLEGNIAVIGAPWDNEVHYDAGAVYVYDLSTGALVHKLLPSLVSSTARSFGSSVAISGNLIAVGHYGDDWNGSGTGSAYVFDLPTGRLLHKTANPLGQVGDLFGTSIGLDGYTAIVGAKSDSTYAAGAGVLYRADAFSGALDQSYISSDLAPYDQLGRTVDLIDGTAVAGVLFDDTQGSNTGAAYSFDSSPDYGGDKWATNMGSSDLGLYGYSVCSIGDVDSDGWADYAVGVPQESSTGLVRVVSGASGLVIRTHSGVNGGDRFGEAVAGGGDINNDGVPDYIVGASDADVGYSNSGTISAYSGADGSLIAQVHGQVKNGHLGEGLCLVGDVNKDGYFDFGGGERLGDSGGVAVGLARVYSGQDGSILYQFEGDDKWDGLGERMGAIGDVNGDSYPDLAVASPGDDDNGPVAGSVRAFSGKDGSVLYTVHGTATIDRFGLGGVVGLGGDLNGDGIEDFVVGAPGNHGSFGGYARVVSGADGATILVATHGTAPLSYFGASVGAVGDQNGDGIADLVVGDPDDDTAAIKAGSVWVFSGADGSVLNTTYGEYRSYYGNAVAGTASLAGGPESEYLVGAYLQRQSGGTKSIGAVHTVVGGTPRPSFGLGADLTVFEDGGPQVVPGWATGMSPNTGSESFEVLVPDPAVFSAGPNIDAATGDLTFTLAPDVNGLSTIHTRLVAGSMTAAPTSRVLTIGAVNDEPSFTVGTNLSSLEDAGPQLAQAWASGISAGPADESGQSLTFGVTTDNPALFTQQPSMDSLGNLSYEAAPDANGIATLSIVLSDDGGTANGGDDTSDPQTATISVTPVNDVPSFLAGVGQVCLEDAGLQIVPGWATKISAGPADEAGQALTFSVTGPDLTVFSQIPSVDPVSGDLTYQPAPDANGSAILWFTLSDDGGTANGGNDTSNAQLGGVTVKAVNDEPSFTVGTNLSSLEDAGPQLAQAWASGISAGPADESGQSLTFGVTTDNPALFTQQPSMDSLGNLSYEAAPDANGIATLSIVLSDDGGTANGGDDTSDPQTVTITVTPVNDEPSFTAGGSHVSLEDDGLQTVANWATAISAGPADEAGQTLTFSVTGPDLSMFSQIPSVDPTSGDLTYQAAPNANGSANFVVILSDDGGTANGGDDTSNSQLGVVTVTAVNDEPSFSTGTSLTSLEDAGPQLAQAWASGISAGPADESSQSLAFTVTTDNAALFTQQPSLDSLGNLSYEATPDANGMATLSIVLTDDGGTANGGDDTSDPQTVTITVTPVNDEPSFTAGGSHVSLEDDGLQTVANWATAISAGPADEAGQTLTFSVTGPDLSMFSQIPSVDPTSGDLTYQAAPNANGSANFVVILSDDGGTANGGDDTSNSQLGVVTVTAVNDEPSFTAGADELILEDAGLQTVSGWATGMSAGPADESSQSLTFTVTTDNPALFSQAPAVDGVSGDLTYQATTDANGMATLTVFVTDDGGTANGGDDTSDPQTALITVTSVNDVPSFTAGPDLTIAEDAGPQLYSGWATSMSAGPANEAGQSLTFLIANDNPALFSVLPAIDALTGDLTYTMAPDEHGIANLDVAIMDDGGTANGGVDTSASQAVTLTTTPVNDVPVIGLSSGWVLASGGTYAMGPYVLYGSGMDDVDTRVGDGVEGMAMVMEIGLRAEHGTLSVPSASGVTFLLGDGIDDDFMVLEGEQADLNTALGHIEYKPHQFFGGFDGVLAYVDDRGWYGAGSPFTVFDGSTVEVKVPLGSASDFDLFGLESVDLLRASTDGRLAAGRKLKMSMFQIAQDSGLDSSQDVAVSGGRLFANQGIFHHGGSVYSGGASVDNTVLFLDAEESVRQGDVVDFAHANNDLVNRALAWGLVPATGAVQYANNVLTLMGSDPDLNVFSVNQRLLRQALQVRLQTPPGAFALLNINGGVIDKTAFGVQITGVDPHSILLNFYEARDIEVGGTELPGSLLAPDAEVRLSKIVVAGNVVAKRVHLTDASTLGMLLAGEPWENTPWVEFSSDQGGNDQSGYTLTFDPENASEVIQVTLEENGVLAIGSDSRRTLRYQASRITRLVFKDRTDMSKINIAADVNLPVELGGLGPVGYDDVLDLEDKRTGMVHVLSNDVAGPVEIDPASVTVTSSPAYGVVEVDAVTGVVRYTLLDSRPLPRNAESDELGYTVRDVDGNVTTARRVRVLLQ